MVVPLGGRLESNTSGGGGAAVPWYCDRRLVNEELADPCTPQRSASSPLASGGLAAMHRSRPPRGRCQTLPHTLCCTPRE